MAIITFIEPDGSRREVAAEPYKTLLEVAEDHNVRIGSACGGVCACSTCHCYIREGLEDLEPVDEIEEDRLDMAFDVRDNSRLGCQVRVPAEPVYLMVEISKESVETWINDNPEDRTG